ncbi:MAG: NifU family protein [Pirellulaceae bacterium]|jgi:Fe-S cluster biogenesis protein NfuA|nr:NifU family protein [Pirellulaceae bacterium]MDP6557326.1 NifU family protein [Pirellulaceae bacterium]MDP6717192.1 NifU family protein [Pirellulaceae bacterium]
MSQEEIRILATPVTTASCKFTVDRPVYADGSFYFGTREKGQDSPLARRLFDIEGVMTVLISHDEITVNKAGNFEWQDIGKLIGAEIREHMQSGEPAVGDELASSIPATEELRGRIEEVLESEVNPAVAGHGGVVTLIDVRKNDVFIKMGGGCQGCGMAAVTLKHGVETAIRQAVPEVGAIYDTTDHAAGRNPYYAAQ